MTNYRSARGPLPQQGTDALEEAIYTAWRGRSQSTRLHAPDWRLSGIHDAHYDQYVGTLAGYPVVLHFWRSFDTVSPPGHSQLRDPAKTRRSLAAHCEVDGQGTQYLTDVIIIGESRRADARYERQRALIAERAQRVFGIILGWL